MDRRSSCYRIAASTGSTRHHTTRTARGMNRRRRSHHRRSGRSRFAGSERERLLTPGEQLTRESESSRAESRGPRGNGMFPLGPREYGLRTETSGFSGVLDASRYGKGGKSETPGDHSLPAFVLTRGDEKTRSNARSSPRGTRTDHKPVRRLRSASPTRATRFRQSAEDTSM